MSDNRHPAGTSVGGQWAPGAAGEVDDSLTGESPFDQYTAGCGLTEEQRNVIDAQLTYIDSEEDVESATDQVKRLMAKRGNTPELADKDLQDIRVSYDSKGLATITASYDEEMDDAMRDSVEDAGGLLEVGRNNTTIEFSDLNPDKHTDSIAISDVAEYHDAHARFQALHQLRTRPETRSAWSVDAAKYEDEHEFIVKYRFHTETDEERRQMIAQRWAKGWPGDPEAIPECPATGKEKL